MLMRKSDESLPLKLSNFSLVNIYTDYDIIAEYSTWRRLREKRMYRRRRREREKEPLHYLPCSFVLAYEQVTFWFQQAACLNDISLCVLADSSRFILRQLCDSSAVAFPHIMRRKSNAMLADLLHSCGGDGGAANYFSSFLCVRAEFHWALWFRQRWVFAFCALFIFIRADRQNWKWMSDREQASGQRWRVNIPAQKPVLWNTQIR